MMIPTAKAHVAERDTRLHAEHHFGYASAIVSWGVA